MSYAISVVEPPPALVGVEEAKAHLRVEGADSDTLIEGLVAAASAYIDGPFGYLQRSVGTQVLRLSLAGFPAHAVRLPFGPITSIVSVNYFTLDGSPASFPSSAYRLSGDLLDLNTGFAWPVGRAGWPVSVDFEAGFGDVPPGIKVAALMVVGDLWSNREARVVAAGSVSEMTNPSVAALLNPYRQLFV